METPMHNIEIINYFHNTRKSTMKRMRFIPMPRTTTDVKTLIQQFNYLTLFFNSICGFSRLSILFFLLKMSNVNNLGVSLCFGPVGYNEMFSIVPAGNNWLFEILPNLDGSNSLTLSYLDTQLVPSVVETWDPPITQFVQKFRGTFTSPL